MALNIKSFFPIEKEVKAPKTELFKCSISLAESEVNDDKDSSYKELDAYERKRYLDSLAEYFNKNKNKRLDII